jgi:hypothetical protein
MKRTLNLIAGCIGAGLLLFGAGALLLRGLPGTTVHAYIALGLGVVVTAALGGGLMALAFHSSRHGWDDDDREP